MTPEALMEFQLSQARLRAVVATLSAVCGVAIPFFGFLGYRYVENIDAASSAVSVSGTNMTLTTIAGNRCNGIWQVYTM